MPIEEVQYGHGWRYPTDRRIFQEKEKYIEYLKNRRQINHFNFNMRKTVGELNSLPNFESIIDWIENNGSFIYIIALVAMIMDMTRNHGILIIGKIFHIMNFHQEFNIYMFSTAR